MWLRWPSVTKDFERRMKAQILEFSDGDSDAADGEDVERAALGLDADATGTYGSDWDRGMDEEDSGRQMLSFGIYLKVYVSRGHREEIRMFPYVEKKRIVDEYGEVIDVAMWARRGQIMPVEEADDELEEAKERKRQEEEVKLSRYHHAREFVKTVDRFREREGVPTACPHFDDFTVCDSLVVCRLYWQAGVNPIC